MGIAQQIDYFFKKVQDRQFLLRLEAKESRMRNFIAEYNSRLPKT